VFCEFMISITEQEECMIPMSKIHALREEFDKSYPAWPEYRKTDNGDVEVGSSVLLPYDECGHSAE